MMSRIFAFLLLCLAALPVFAAEKDAPKLVVISDINETLRSGDKPVEGMAAALQRLAAAGADFHYVSFAGKSEEADLTAFIKENGFPQGTFHLRPENEPGTAFDTKSRAVRIIFTQNAGRPVVMIGDSGMYDPDIYGLAARNWPKRVQHIYLRDVTGGKGRIGSALEGAEGKWTLFDDPAVIDAQPKR